MNIYSAGKGEDLMDTGKKSVFLMLAAAFLWSLAGMFIKMIDWEPLAIVCVRSLVVAVSMGFMLREKKIRFSWPLLGAAAAYAVFSYCYVISTKLTTAANAVMMQYTAPVYVALLSGIVLKEKIRKTDWICLAAVLCGMCLFFMDQAGGGSLSGNIIAIGNGISFAVFSICLRFQKEGNPEQSVFLGGLIGFLFGIPFVVGKNLPDVRSLTVIIVAGIVMSVGYRLFTEASKHLSALQSVMLPIIDPVLNPIWVFLAVGECPGLVSLCGAVVVLFAITLRSLLLILSPQGELDKK